MNFVDEEHVALFEIGELGGEIAGLGDDRAGGRAEIDAELAGDDLRQRRLAEAGRPDEQHMVERLAARLGGLDEDFEILSRRLLAGEIAERERTQRDVRIVVALFGRHQPAGRGGQRIGLQLCRMRGKGRYASLSPRRKAREPLLVAI